MAFTKTLQDLFDTSYAIIKQPEDSSAYDRDTFLLPKINESQNKMIFGGLRNLLTNESLDKANLPFNNSEAFYKSVAYAVLGTTATVGGTTLAVDDSSNFLASGHLWIDGDIVTYTGNTGTGFTGCSGIGFAHLAGVYVRQLFDLPTDYSILLRAWYKNKFILTNINQRDLVNRATFNQYNFNPFSDDNLNNINNNEYYYSIIDDSHLLPIVSNENAFMIKIQYEKTVTQLVKTSPTTQTLAIPDEFALSTIPYLATGAMLIERGEPDYGMKLQSIGWINCKAMYDYYNVRKAELQYDSRIRTSSDLSLNI